MPFVLTSTRWQWASCSSLCTRQHRASVVTKQENSELTRKRPGRVKTSVSSALMHLRMPCFCFACHLLVVVLLSCFLKCGKKILCHQSAIDGYVQQLLLTFELRWSWGCWGRKQCIYCILKLTIFILEDNTTMHPQAINLNFLIYIYIYVFIIEYL